MPEPHLSFRRTGLRPTQARTAVLEIFQSGKQQHYTIDNVYFEISKTDRSCSLSSVYRALASLVEAGFLIRTHLGESRLVYELNRGQQHFHLYCEKCGKLVDFEHPEMASAMAAIAQQHGFSQLRTSLVAAGRCSDCE